MSLASLAEADPGFPRVHQVFVLPSIEKTKWKYNIINNLIHGVKASSEPTNSPKFQFVRKLSHDKHVFLSHINILPWKQKVRTNISIFKDSLRGEWYVQTPWYNCFKRRINGSSLHWSILVSYILSTVLRIWNTRKYKSISMSVAMDIFYEV